MMTNCLSSQEVVILGHFNCAPCKRSFQLGLLTVCTPTSKWIFHCSIPTGNFAYGMGERVDYMCIYLYCVCACMRVCCETLNQGSIYARKEKPSSLLGQCLPMQQVLSYWSFACVYGFQFSVFMGSVHVHVCLCISCNFLFYLFF